MSLGLVKKKVPNPLPAVASTHAIGFRIFARAHTTPQAPFVVEPEFAIQCEPPGLGEVQAWRFRDAGVAGSAQGQPTQLACDGVS